MVIWKDKLIGHIVIIIIWNEKHLGHIVMIMIRKDKHIAIGHTVIVMIRKESEKYSRHSHNNCLERCGKLYQCKNQIVIKNLKNLELYQNDI